MAPFSKSLRISIVSSATSSFLRLFTDSHRGLHRARHQGGARVPRFRRLWPEAMREVIAGPHHLADGPDLLRSRPPGIKHLIVPGEW